MWFTHPPAFCWLRFLSPFPYISREIIPILEARGTDEEEAAALMGAGGRTIFRRITFPHIKWALLYGVVLCAARALGEFGAGVGAVRAFAGTDADSAAVY